MKNAKLWVVFLISFVLFIFWAQAFPITDTVESNYALTAKEMVTSGNWISPQIYGKFWFDKPVMIYWLLALSMKLFGYSALAVRIVPALAGALGVSFIYWFVAKLRNERAGMIAAALLATSLQYFIISKLIVTDSLLFIFNAAALAFFYLGYTDQAAAKRWYYLMYPCLGLAVLTKGPVGVMLPGLIILIFLAWRKNWAELRRLKLGVGILLLMLVALPWYGIMFLRHGQEFIHTFFGIHNYLRATVSEHPRDNVFYYYLILFMVSTLPWTDLVIGGLSNGWRNYRRHHQELPLFLMIWVGVFLIFYTLMATKYPTYTFPMLFPLAVLTALYIEDRLEQNVFKMNFAFFVPTLIWYAILILAGHLAGVSLGIFLALNALVLLALLAGWRWSKGANRVWLLIGGTIVSYLFFSLWVVPGIANDRSGKQLAQTLTRYEGQPIGTYQFYSTSAVYYSGNLITMLESPDTIHNYRNPAFSWFAKYTMPVATVREFVGGSSQPKLIIVPRSSLQRFRHDAAGMTVTKLAESAERIEYRVTVK